MRGLAAIVFVLTLGSAVLWQATDGLEAFTSEAARRLAVERSPRPLPDPLLQDQSGRYLRLSDYRARLLFVEFIFTRCPTLCLALGDSFARITEALPSARYGHDIALLSISFDIATDGPRELADYAARFGADGENWRVARIAQAPDVQPLLDAFGVVAIRDSFMGFQHNAALHLVDREGRLIRVFDFDAPQAALAALDR